ncbi:DUF1501 domain-containing protein [Hansschlegelia beijingensis]
MILRGGLDGLTAVPPHGDPSYHALRSENAAGVRLGSASPIALDGFFSLNPSLKSLGSMFRQGEAIVFHAVATPYRDRCHFDGLSVLENGTRSPGLETGWLNRALSVLPTERFVGQRLPGIGVGATAPLILRGPAPTLTWSPQAVAMDLLNGRERLRDLSSTIDPTFADAIERRAGLQALARGGPMTESRVPAGRSGFIELAAGAGRLLNAPEGPRVAVMSFDGWDTHTRQGAEDGRLSRLLADFDAALDTLRSTLRKAWAETVVIAVTEFGRTVRLNQTYGTDHGTGSVAFLAGGALRGGYVAADWPGLNNSALYEHRDLRPTQDVRRVLKGILADHLSIPEILLSREVFPESSSASPLRDLCV